MFFRSISVSYFRNFIFGVEDSLVSTVGLLSGIAVANVPKSTILLTGVVLIFVEAISMSAGSFLSESSVDEYTSHTEKITRSSIVSSLVMFFSYFLSGFIVLLPYLLLPVSEALVASIFLSIIALFILGVVGAEVSRTRIIKNGFKMVIVGGVAILVGIIAGNWLSGF